jgi:hypothetical protein
MILLLVGLLCTARVEMSLDVVIWLAMLTYQFFSEA